MSKHILMYDGSGPSLTKALKALSNRLGITYIETLGDNIIVEGNYRDVRSLMVELPGWRSSSVRKVKHPDNRVHVRRP